MKRQAEVIQLGEHRTRRFLQDLAAHPFVTVVLGDDGQVKVYAKGIGLDEATVRTIKATLDTIDGE